MDKAPGDVAVTDETMRQKPFRKSRTPAERVLMQAFWHTNKVFSTHHKPKQVFSGFTPVTPELVQRRKWIRNDLTFAKNH
jgi:hypothetical protein